MARLQKKKQAAVTTGSAGSSGIPCAMVLRLIRALLGDRLDCPRPPEAKLRRVSDNALARVALDTSVGVSGPCDFTSASCRSSARQDALRHISGHRLPASRAVTIAMRPSCEAGWRKPNTNSEKRKTNISAGDLEPGFHDEIARKIGFSARGAVGP